MLQETRPCPEGDLGVLSVAPCASRTRAVRSGAAGTVGSAQPLAARISYSLSSFAPSQVAGSGAVWGPAASAPCAPRAPRRCCEQTDLRGVRSGAATLPASSPGHPLQTGPGSLAQTGGVPPPCPVRSHLALRTPRAMGPARLLCHPDVPVPRPSPPPRPCPSTAVLSEVPLRHFALRSVCGSLLTTTKSSISGSTLPLSHQLSAICTLDRHDLCVSI